MEFLSGAIFGAIALFVGLMLVGVRKQRREAPARAEVIVSGHQKDAAVKIARAYLSAISERHAFEPMSAKIAVKAQSKIAEALGEQSPLDEILKKPRTETNK